VGHFLTPGTSDQARTRILHIKPSLTNLHLFVRYIAHILREVARVMRLLLRCRRPACADFAPARAAIFGKELPMKSMKLMKWMAAGALIAAPAIGLARTHHVTAAAPLAAVSSTPVVASALDVKPAKAAIKHRKLSARSHVKAKHLAHKSLKHAVKHTARHKVTHKHRAKVSSKKH